MVKDRRFTENEIAAIFEHAAEAEKSALRKVSGQDGLTLAELQEIGREVGLSSEHIARAAAVVAAPSKPEETRTTLGLPTHVARTVDLPRNLTDEEWDRVVVALRETFQARGEVRDDGSLRQWTNGNLQALLEPSESGHRLRLRSFHENARNGLMGGLLATAFILVTLLIVTVTGRLAFDPDDLLLVAFGMMGLTYAAFSAGRIKRWAGERARQMEEIAAGVAAMVQTDTAIREETPARSVIETVSEPGSDVAPDTRRRTRF